MRSAAVAAAIALAVSACGQRDPGAGTPGSAGQVVARVDGSEVTVEELTRRRSLSTATHRRHALDAAIATRLAAAEARRRALERTPDVQQRLAAIRREAGLQEEIALRDALAASLAAEIAPTEAELREHYQATLSAYFAPQMGLRVATFASKQELDEAEVKLGSAGRLDPATSTPVGPSPVSELPPELLPGALRLEKSGDRVRIARGGEWLLVELVERLSGAALPFDSVRGRVQESLRRLRSQQLFRAEVERLRAQATVEIDAAVLANDELWRD